MLDPYIDFRNAGEGPPSTPVDRENLNAMQVQAREEIALLAAGQGVNPYEIANVQPGQVPTPDGADGFDAASVPVGGEAYTGKVAVWNGTVWAPTVLPTPSAVPAGNRVSFLGDSTVTQSGAGAAGRTWNHAWPNHACVLSGGRMVMALNDARGGFTSAGVLSIQVPVILADPVGVPGTVMVCVGTNDLATGTGGIVAGITPAQTRANIAAIDAALLAAGVQNIIWCTILPRNTAALTGGVAGATVADIHAKTQALNAWLKRFCAEKKRTCIDLYALMVDPATGEWRGGTTLSGDGIHPTYLGYSVIAEHVVQRVAPLLPTWAPPLATGPDDARNLLPNGFFLTDANTDNVPDGWTVAGTNMAAPPVTVSGVLGKAMRVSPAVGGGATGTVTSDPITTGFAPGDRIGFGFGAQVKGVNASSMVYGATITYTGATSNGTFKPMGPFRADMVAPGVMWAEDIVPPGTTAVTVTFDLSNSQGTFDVSQATIRNLTTI